MGAKGKLVAAQEFPSKGDVFHQLLKNDPHSLSISSPQSIQSVTLHEGEIGTQGSVIVWNFTLDGKEKVSKSLLETVDDDKKLIAFRVVEGDLLVDYKDILATFHVESKDGTDFVTWTFEYETLNDDGTGPPFTLVQLAFGLVVDAEKAQP